MRLTQKKSIEERISSILDKEAALLTSGALGMIDSLTNEKQKLIEELGQGKHINSNKLLKNIHRKAKQNTHLYEATLKGLQLAMTKIKQIKEVTTELKVYGKDGQVVDRANPTKSISKKA